MARQLVEFFVVVDILTSTLSIVNNLVVGFKDEKIIVYLEKFLIFFLMLTYPLYYKEKLLIVSS